MLPINQDRLGYTEVANKMKQDEAKQNINKKSQTSRACIVLFHAMLQVYTGTAGALLILVTQELRGMEAPFELVFPESSQQGEGHMVPNALALKGFCSPYISQRNLGSHT